MRSVKQRRSPQEPKKVLHGLCGCGCGGAVSRGKTWLKSHHWRQHYRPGDTPETVKANERRKRLYGVTPEQFDEMLASQGGKCAICRTSTPQVYRNGRRTWCIDHNHVTGVIRAVLCGHCNAGIGLFGEDPILLEAAVRYLEKHQ